MVWVVRWWIVPLVDPFKAAFSFHFFGAKRDGELLSGLANSNEPRSSARSSFSKVVTHCRCLVVFQLVALHQQRLGMCGQFDPPRAGRVTGACCLHDHDGSRRE